MTTLAIQAQSNVTESLAELEEIIREGETSFYQIGKALRTIRDQALYKPKHSSFHKYCTQRWDMTRRRADQLICAANLRDLLIENCCSQLPANESQIRPLTKKELTDQERVDLWLCVVETAQRQSITITASFVRKVIKQERCQEQNQSGDDVVTSLSSFLNTTARILDAFQTADWETGTPEDIAPLLNQLKQVERKTRQLRSLLTKAKNCCPECSTPINSLMEACVACGWNSSLHPIHTR